MSRVLVGIFIVVLSGCQCGPLTEADAGQDAGLAVDSGTGDAGPVCGPEICDGIDNDCDGTVDLAPNGSALVQLCPLQLGTCQGASVRCEGGKYPSCVPEYGPKYEELESLCDGVDNDCNGVVDVSQWRPLGEVGAKMPSAVSVPGGWYVATGISGQMFDEQLRPTSELFLVGHPGETNARASAPIVFGGYLNQVFNAFPNPALTYLRRLNLDGTYPTVPDGGPLEFTLVPNSTVPSSQGVLRANSDQSTMLVAFARTSGATARQEVLTVWPDGGTRAQLTKIGDTGWQGYESAAVGTENFVIALSYESRLQLQLYSPELVALGPTVDLATPGESRLCSVSTETLGVNAGIDSVLAVCADERHLYAAGNVYAGGTLTPFWEIDAGTISEVHVLPSYARATVFWTQVRAGLPSTLWMTQVNGPPVAIAEFQPAATGVDFASSIRGGYLIEALLDGGQGLRPYGAYVCPL